LIHRTLKKKNKALCMGSYLNEPSATKSNAAVSAVRDFRFDAAPAAGGAGAIEADVLLPDAAVDEPEPCVDFDNVVGAAEPVDGAEVVAATNTDEGSDVGVDDSVVCATEMVPEDASEGDMQGGDMLSGVKVGAGSDAR
jgi:hypothetical protein